MIKVRVIPHHKTQGEAKCILPDSMMITQYDGQMEVDYVRHGSRTYKSDMYDLYVVHEIPNPELQALLEAHKRRIGTLVDKIDELQARIDEYEKMEKEFHKLISDVAKFKDEDEIKAEGIEEMLGKLNYPPPVYLGNGTTAPSLIAVPVMQDYANKLKGKSDG